MAESESVKERAYNYEKRYHGCSQCTLLALQEFLGLEDELTFKSASYLCGGLAFSGNTCGALSAGVMALSMKYGRANIEEGLVGLIRGMLPAHRLVKWFEGEFGTTTCHEISGIQMDEEILKALAAAPEAMEAALPAELIEKCSQLVSKTAEKVAEIISAEG